MILAATGSYASQDRQRELAAWISTGSLPDCTALLARWIRAAPARARQRRLEVPPAVVVDLTRTSRAVETTGIPRVARALAAEAVARGYVPIVWEGGAPGPVELGNEGSDVVFPDSAWGAAGVRRRGAAALKRSYWHAMRWLSMVRGGAQVVRLLRAVAAPLGDAINDRSGPTHAYLLANCHYVSPEVNRPDTVTRILAWREACDSVRLTVTLHDLLPLVEPRFFAPDQRVEHIDFMNLVAHADCVVVASDHLVEQVEGSCQLLGAQSTPAVEVVPYGSDAASWIPKGAPEERRPAFLMVGSMELRKNHALALRALGLLSESGTPTTLHVVGSARPVHPDTVAALDYARRSGVEVIEHRGATDSHLAGIMDSCIASLYLSWAEGFGLPVVESLARGLPVIATDTPPHRAHQRYGGVVLTAVDRPTELADLLRKYIENASLRDDLRRSITRDSLPRGYVEWAERVFHGGLPRRVS